MVKNKPANLGNMTCGFDPWVGKITWRRAWQYTPVFLPGKSHRQRSLASSLSMDTRVRHDLATKSPSYPHMYNENLRREKKVKGA